MKKVLIETKLIKSNQFRIKRTKRNGEILSLSVIFSKFNYKKMSSLHEKYNISQWNNKNFSKNIYSIYDII